MAEKGTYRSKYDERDESGYIVSTSDETGAMVIKSLKGPGIPKFCTSEDQLLLRYGNPSADNPEIFEALSFVQQAPIWMVSAIHEDAKWGGVYITASTIAGFTGGQVNPDIFVFTEIATQKTDTIGVGDGTNKTWSGTLTETPINEFSLRLKRGSVYMDAYDDNGDITGSDITGTGTIDYSSGDISFETKYAVSSGAVVSVEYDYNVDMFDIISHVFLNASPCADDIAVNIISTGGYRFKMIVTKKTTNSFLAEYNYSLIKEKDGNGANLYIFDIFSENDYVIPKVNSAYMGEIPSLSASTIVNLSGGKRGSTPTDADRISALDYFKKPNKYAAKIFMDCTGVLVNDIVNIIENYQYYSFGISTIPMGSTVTQKVTYRQNLGIDSDSTALYCNWRKIYDKFNDSFAWISNVGSVGKKMAEMADVYDGESPAGIDENGHGGQIADWRTIQMEDDFDDAELELLDNAQINPIVFDQGGYGVYIAGDKTLQVTASDTSFIHTRRIDNYIIEKIVKYVMRLREFRNNTPNSQLKAKAMVEQFLNPIVAKQLITEVRVICDDTNNTAAMKTQRKFVLDVIKKSTVNNQKTLLRLTRVGQGAVISEITPL